MAAKRLPMRKLREILRLKHERGLSHRAIARACGIAAGTVASYVGRARRAGLSWPLPDDLDDAGLEARLFPAPEAGRERSRRGRRPGWNLPLWAEWEWTARTRRLDRVGRLRDPSRAGAGSTGGGGSTGERDAGETASGSPVGSPSVSRSGGSVCWLASGLTTRRSPSPVP